MDINKIYNSPAEEFLQKLPSNFIDLTVTSPPYDNMRAYHGSLFDIELIARELLRCTKPGGVCVWVVGDQVINGSESGSSFRQALKFIECGWLLHDTMIYHKDSISFPETNRYSQIFEYMFVFSKGKPKTVNIIKDRVNKWAGHKIKGGERQASGSIKNRRPGNELSEKVPRFNVWHIPSGFGKSTSDNIAFEHPAIFPEKLAADHIISWSNEGDLICDVFSGSATTAKMALQYNRDFIGSELSSKYYEIGNKRLQPYINQLKINL